MLNKKDHPKVEVNGWIKVEGSDCLITQVYRSYSPSGACEVVTNPTKPINRDVCWNGKEWVFSDLPVFVNAAETPRLKEFTQLLQQC